MRWPVRLCRPNNGRPTDFSSYDHHADHTVGRVHFPQNAIPMELISTLIGLTFLAVCAMAAEILILVRRAG